jgi:hypothetical protein
MLVADFFCRCETLVGREPERGSKSAGRRATAESIIAAWLLEDADPYGLPHPR